jgi:hypothetical protein
MSPRDVAKAEGRGLYGPKTTVYYIEFRVERLRDAANLGSL